MHGRTGNKIISFPISELGEKRRKRTFLENYIDLENAYFLIELVCFHLYVMYRIKNIVPKFAHVPKLEVSGLPLLGAFSF